MRIIYKGPLVGVEIAATRQNVKKGEPVEVDDKVAAELIRQKAWDKAPTPKPPKPQTDEKE